MTDPIADFLTRIRNANRASLPTLETGYSKLKERIARILKQEGFVADVTVEGAPVRRLKLRLKYQGRKGVIQGLRRASSPGLRRYAGATDMPRVLGGMGVAIVSTPRGVMTGSEAHRLNVGGEVMCYVW
jgi:small subunit ribosomal protein S8